MRKARSGTCQAERLFSISHFREDSLERKANSSYSVTADFKYIETALKLRWEPFQKLAKEIESFQPKTREDFAEPRVKELARLRALNPDSSDEELLILIDGQFDAALIPGRQMSTRFTDSVMAEYVTVAFLAHALSEAMINAILAIGLGQSGAEDLFSLLEKADVKEKWTSGPMAFHSRYSFSKSGALYETLQQLTRQRNALVHYKVGLEINGEIKIRGSKLVRSSLTEDLEWMRRFFSVPFDLVEYARRALPGQMFLLLHDSEPIERYRPHLS